MPRKSDPGESLSGPSAAAVSAAMREVREERYLSVADTAKAADTAPGRLSAVESGRREPDFVLMMRVARALGVQPSEFIRRAEQPRHGGELTDALILAAMERAQRHARHKDAGVSYGAVVAHLGMPMGSATGRRLRPRFREIEAAGLIAPAKRHGVIVYTTTRKGAKLLRDAEPVQLPESPQHRQWREARAAATERVGGFRDDLRALLERGAALVADDATGLFLCCSGRVSGVSCST